MNSTTSAPAVAGRRRALVLVAAAAAAAAAVSLAALSQDTASATALPKNAAAVSGVAPAAVPAVPAVPALPAAPAQLPGLSSVGKVASGVTGAVPAAAAPAAHAPAAAAPAAAAPCTGLDAAVAAFMMHFYAAHLEEGLGQQLGDIVNLDQYIKTHTVLIENMIKPSVGGSDAALGVFLQHVYAAHLEASPGQQVADISNLDQYVKTHTVMIENMVKPLSGSDVSSC